MNPPLVSGLDFSGSDLDLDFSDSDVVLDFSGSDVLVSDVLVSDVLVFLGSGSEVTPSTIFFLQKK